MPRISGVDIPQEKKNKVALTAIYGIGRQNVLSVLHQASVDPEKRAKDLQSEEVVHLQEVIEKMNVEGNLREAIRSNIERLKRINTYRGLRHKQNLPVRGQRTRTNARTKRGKRVTIGAIKKQDTARGVRKAEDDAH